MPGSNRTNGSVVATLEREFAPYVGAEYGIACCNGTATLHTALVALGVKPGDRVAVPPLTMASTTLAVLHAGATPVFREVSRETWTMQYDRHFQGFAIPVSLYGLSSDWGGALVVDDAAETLNPHLGCGFTSYSFQASKILSAGEGGMLVTDNPHLAGYARQFRDLGYPENARASMKSPDAIRHMVIGWNYRMSDAQAQLVLDQLPHADALLERRRYAAQCYADAIRGTSWVTPQFRPEGWPHSYWTYAIACDTKERADRLQEAIVTLGGERCYRAWRLTYQEPAFRHLAPDGTCPVAEDLQPRILQLQTNHRDAAESEHAADCLHRALQIVAP